MLTMVIPSPASTVVCYRCVWQDGSTEPFGNAYDKSAIERFVTMPAGCSDAVLGEEVMTDTAQIIGILLSIVVICACVLVSGHGLPNFRRGGRVYRATPSSLWTATRALDHLGSYGAIQRAAQGRADGDHVVRVPGSRARSRYRRRWSVRARG